MNTANQDLELLSSLAFLMHHRHVSEQQLAKLLKISHKKLVTYFRQPGTMTLKVLHEMAHVLEGKLIILLPTKQRK